MKTRTLLTTIVLFLCSIILQAQTTAIPDANFEQALIDLGIDSDGTINQSVATSDISAITFIPVSNKNINDLTGIEGFISLTHLYCNNNQLTSLDVSNNPALTSLNCQYNQLTSLDVSSSPALTHLRCENNQLTSLNLSSSPALTYLDCQYNQLTSLDFTQNTALTTLRCFNNQLTSLDVSQNNALKTLSCSHNQLPSLDVTQNPALTSLSCGYNQLTSIDVTQNTALGALQCVFNQITSLDVSQNTALKILSFSHNQIPNLDVSNHPVLDVLQCNNNQLTSLDVSSNLVLTHLDCQHNPLTSLDVTQNTSLTQLFCFQNQLTILDVTQNTSLQRLWCSGNQLESLDVTNNTALDLLYCEGNTLTSLDVSSNNALTYLRCQDNQLISLDVSNKPVLTHLWCGHNQLLSLNVSNSPALKRLYCSYNKLTSLNVSNSPALFYLRCYQNQLTSLDVSNNPALSVIYCYNNQLVALDVSSCTALKHLSCSYNQITSLDVSYNLALQSFWCKYNQLTSLSVKNGNNINMGGSFSATNNPYLSCIQVDDAAWSNANWQYSKDATATYSENCNNLPPVAVCQDVSISADVNCEATVTQDLVDNGSFDPDGDPITLSLDPPGPYQLGETTVTLTVEDDSGETDQCTATVTVVDATAPVITTITSPTVIWPPNHQYESFVLSDFVLSVSDNCAFPTINDVNIVKATSDELENGQGGGDGNTLNDIVIANDCKSIQLRKERKAGGNGRVYTIYFELDDGNGNTGYATCQVEVPPNNNGTAIDDGAVYEELGNCGNKSSFVVDNNSESEIELFNYPNPFSYSTKLIFSVSKANKTTLKVYNSMGKEVVVLFDGFAEADQNYEFIFNGERLPKGLYICHMQSGDKHITKRMLLSK